MDQTQNVERAEAFARRCHLAGWILFVACALFFIASAWKNGDALALAGSLLFLIACFIFLAPLMLPASRTETPAEDRPGRELEK